MSDSTDPVVRDKWVARVLGLNVARVTSPMATPADSARPTSPLSPSPQTGLMAQASAQGALGKPVELPITAQPKQIFKAASGREIDVRRGPDGSVALTAPQPPLREITFSGGGGKGAALPGAIDAVRSLSGRWPLAVASSSPRSLIGTVLDTADLASAFAATVSSEEVPRGKPAPDVYLAAADRLSVPPKSCAAIEDSSNGLRSAAAAGLTVIAVPRPEYPPAPDALAQARLVLPSLTNLTADTVAALS